MSSLMGPGILIFSLSRSRSYNAGVPATSYSPAKVICLPDQNLSLELSFNVQRFGILDGGFLRQGEKRCRRVVIAHA